MSNAGTLPLRCATDENGKPSSATATAPSIRREANTETSFAPKIVPAPDTKKGKIGYLPMLVYGGLSTKAASSIARLHAGFSLNGAKHQGTRLATPNCGSMFTVVVQYDFSNDTPASAPTNSPRTTAADLTKFAGSSGPEKSGIDNDHDTTNAKSEATSHRTRFMAQD